MVCFHILKASFSKNVGAIDRGKLCTWTSKMVGPINDIRMNVILIFLSDWRIHQLKVELKLEMCIVIFLLYSKVKYIRDWMWKILQYLI